MITQESPRIDYSKDLLASRNLSKAVYESIINANFEMINMARVGQPFIQEDLISKNRIPSYLRYELINKREIKVGENYRLYILNSSAYPDELCVLLLRHDPKVKKEIMKDRWDKIIKRKDLEESFENGEVVKGLTAFLKECLAKDISKYEYFNFSDT